MKQKYILSLQTLRALAIVGILTYHCGLLPLGAWGVSIFFILSGFVLMLKYHEVGIPSSFRGNIAFAYKSIRKIYPLHILMMVIVIIREYIQFGSFEWNIPRITSNIFLLSSWFPESLGLSCYNGVAWFLSTILFSYFLFPALLKLFNEPKSKNPVIIILFVIGLQGLLLILYKLLNLNNSLVVWLSYENPIFRAGDFLIGMALFSLYSERKEERKIDSCLGMVCMLLFVITCLLDVIYFRPQGIDGFRKTLLYTPSAFMFVYVFALSNTRFVQLFTTKTMVYIGNMSGLYFLIHQVMIYNTKWAIFGTGEWGGLKDRIVVCVVATILTFFFAYLYKKAQIHICK